jgi:hypothetical protein
MLPRHHTPSRHSILRPWRSISSRRLRLLLTALVAVPASISLLGVRADAARAEGGQTPIEKAASYRLGTTLRYGMWGAPPAWDAGDTGQGVVRSGGEWVGGVRGWFAGDGAATGGVSNVAAAEWFEGADPGVGLGSAMSPVDGVFDSPSEQVQASLSLPSGQHTLWVRARDAAGNWGAVVSVTFTVPPPLDVIFQDGFASGTLAAWSKANRLTAANLTGQAALHGSDPYGLRVAVAGTMNHFLIDSSPVAGPSYHARFYFDPNATITGSASWTVFLARSAAGSQLFSLQLSAANSATPRLRLSMRSNGAIVTTPWVNVTDAPHAIEIAWSSTNRAASLSVDGVVVVSRSGLRNASQRIEEVRLGPTSGLVGGSAGVLYFDDFVSTRTATIGP